MTSRVHWAIASVGKSSGAGRPPPNEMTSGWSVTLSISRMVEARMRAVRAAKRTVRGTVAIGQLYSPKWKQAPGPDWGISKVYTFMHKVKTALDRWGNSLGVRLPKAIAE